MLSVALVSLCYAVSSANAYWLMGTDFLTSQRIDPIIAPGVPSGHVHGIVGGSNFGFNVTTEQLRQSECTSIPIKEDKSAYWAPKAYFQHKDGSFTSLGGGVVIYYLFDKGAPGSVTAFPDDFRMIAGNPTLRSYDSSSKAQQAVTFLCLDFEKGTKGPFHELPKNMNCPSGVRAQINFPKCWNGKDMDSPDHTSHVAYPSGGPDSGTCNDPDFPVTLPRIFMEIYWEGAFESADKKADAMNPEQPYVLAHGDPTGYGHHADFYNGWEKGALQKAVDGCTCNDYGDPQCCADAGIFTYDAHPTKHCKITNSVDEEVFGNMAKLPGNNPVQDGPGIASMMSAESVPAILSPVYVYYGDKPDQVGEVVAEAKDVVHAGGDAATGGDKASSDSGASAPASSSSAAAAGAAATKGATNNASTGNDNAAAGSATPPSSSGSGSSSSGNSSSSTSEDSTCNTDSATKHGSSKKHHYGHHHNRRFARTSRMELDLHAETRDLYSKFSF